MDVVENGGSAVMPEAAAGEALGVCGSEATACRGAAPLRSGVDGGRDMMRGAGEESDNVSVSAPVQ